MGQQKIKINNSAEAAQIANGKKKKKTFNGFGGDGGFGPLAQWAALYPPSKGIGEAK